MKWISGLFLLFSIINLPKAAAALGDKAEAVTTDAKNLKAIRKNADVFRKYSTQEMVSDANTVKEFVSNDGTIFAIVWNGISPPDHAVLLGSNYEATFEKGRKAHKRKHGNRTRKIASENLVVQQWGQMRALEGRMYDPSLIPEGVSVDEIK